MPPSIDDPEYWRDRDPKELIADTRLETATKVRILENLRVDAVELQTATAENMPGDGTAGDYLQRIDAALETLCPGHDNQR